MDTVEINNSTPEAHTTEEYCENNDNSTPEAHTTEEYCENNDPTDEQSTEDIGLIISLAPPRVAVNQAMHYMDNFNSGRFQKFDFGPKENMKLYGQKIPPLYNLSAVTAPIAFFYGQQDSFFVDGDYYESAELLPNVVLIHRISYDRYTHSDFILARNSTELAYEPTYKLFKDYDDGIVPPRVKVPDNYI
ncbi:lipase 3-like [Sitophilus oryzae]|uniref:Lipase 3-like n=1 Tax=Sitophilus oryzae TaxID=7048 RepID=A0A6J2YRS2_SITOR|nr:lipase 3-like [Sitophilus oryzae]